MNVLLLAAVVVAGPVVCFFAGYGLRAYLETRSPARRRGGYLDLTWRSSSAR